MQDAENHIVLPHAEPDESNHERDDELRHESRRHDDEIDADQRLCSRANRAITKLSESGVFDQRDLIGLLKDLRNRIDPDPTMARRQAW